MIDIDKIPSRINIGNQGEKNIAQVQFDVSVWDALYPGAEYSITYIRPGETSVSPELDGAVSHVEGVLTWAPSPAVMEVPGSGTVVIICTPVGKEKRSIRTFYHIVDGHGPAGEAPDPVADWITDANSTLNNLKSIRFTINENGELEVNI